MAQLCKSPIAIQISTPCPQSTKCFAIQKPFSQNPLISTKIISDSLKFPIFSSTSFLNSSLQRRPCCASSSSSTETTDALPSTSIVFVKGLPLSTSEGRLKLAFSPFGDVNKVKIIIDKKTKQSLGFAYIWFSSQESAHTAVAEMNGEFFDGRFISVMLAKPGSCMPRARAAEKLLGAASLVILYVTTENQKL